MHKEYIISTRLFTGKDFVKIEIARFDQYEQAKSFFLTLPKKIKTTFTEENIHEKFHIENQDIPADFKLDQTVISMEITAQKTLGLFGLRHPAKNPPFFTHGLQAWYLETIETPVQRVPSYIHPMKKIKPNPSKEDDIVPHIL
jgi:hypothetical protein